MADKDKQVTDKPVEEANAEEVKTEEPKVEESVSSPTAPAGTDQQGRQLYNVKCAKCGKQT